jgi:hypothetical protein
MQNGPDDTAALLKQLVDGGGDSKPRQTVNQDKPESVGIDTLGASPDEGQVTKTLVPIVVSTKGESIPQRILAVDTLDVNGGMKACP